MVTIKSETVHCICSIRKMSCCSVCTTMSNDKKLYFFRESIACSVTYCGNFKPFVKWKHSEMTLTCKNYHSICYPCFRSMTIDDVTKYGFREFLFCWPCVLCRSPYNWIQVFKIPHYNLRSNKKYDPFNINHVLLL